MEEISTPSLQPAEQEQPADALAEPTPPEGAPFEGFAFSSSGGLSIDQFPTSPLPAIDQWPTQPIPALAGEPYFFPQGDFMDNESREGLDALLQPAIERMAETGPHPAAESTGATGNYLAMGRNLIKSSGIYALGSLASPLASLVLSPFLAHRLSPTNYGILAVLTTVIGLAAGITQLGLGSAFFRVYNYEFTEPEDRRAVLATVMLLLTLTTLPVVVLASLLSSPLAGLVPGGATSGSLITLAAWVVFVQNLTVPGFAWMRAENRPLFFTLLTILNLLIVLGANLLLVGVLNLGVAGSLLATGGGYACVALGTLPLIFWHTRLRVRRDVGWSLVTFGAPQVLSYISFWVLQLADRYLLGLLGSLSQVASYSVAYSLGGVLSTLVISPFSLAWPAMMFSVAKRKDAPQIFQVVFRYFSTLLLFVAFGVSIASTVLLTVLFPKSYHSAAPIIPVIAESIVFYGLYIVLMCGASIRRITWMPAAFTAAAALTNVLVNLVLIPLYGSGGAAASTLIAYILLAVVAYVANQRIYFIPYDLKRFLSALLIGVALYLGAALVSAGWGDILRWSLAIACLVVYAGFLLFLLPGGIDMLRTQGARFVPRIISDRRVS